MNVSDATLVSGTLDGDRSAFAELYDRRARLIRAICYDVTRDSHAAADLTQEVFLRAYTGLGQLRDRKRFSAWLVGIARQVGREWRRKRGRRPQLALDPDLCEDRADEGPDERLRTLRAAITNLPERERLALHAFYLQELDAEQARAVLGLSRSGLYRVLSRARRRLRNIFSGMEVRQ